MIVSATNPNLYATGTPSTTTVVPSNQSIFNSMDIGTIVEWTVVGTVVGMLINHIFRLKNIGS
jgi:hypothetical protein